MKKYILSLGKNKKGEYISDIIKDIVTSSYGLSSSKKFVQLEQTNIKTNIVFPYTRPLDAIKMLTLQAKNEKDETNYLFFETLDGYHYTSFRKLAELAGQDEDIPNIYSQLANWRELGNFKTQIRAEKLQVVSAFDTMYATSQGYFSSLTIAPDVLAGKCEAEISSIASVGATNDYASQKKLNRIELYPPEIGLGVPSTSRIFLVPTTHLIAENTKVTQLDPTLLSPNNYLAKTIDGKNRELLGLQSRCVRGVIAGAPELHPGKIINLIFPTPINNSNFGASFNDISSGRYIVIAAQHTIKNDGRNKFLYETTFEAVSDSRLPQ